MNWLLVGAVAGSIVTSSHADKEACMGRVAVLKEQKIEATCVPVPSGSGNSLGSTLRLWNGSFWSYSDGTPYK